jgi:agmatinase
MNYIDELALYLRPPSQGVYAVSTGKKEIEEFAVNYLGEYFLNWKDQLLKIKDHKVAILAIPSDTGAGILRGASRGPEGIRKSLGKAPCLDLGDIITVPQLLHDSMLSIDQIKKIRKFLYPNIYRKLPVSPMSILERVYQLIKKINPKMRIHLLGGDHTCSWFSFKNIYNQEDDLGILHFDAHTDLMPHRMGVEYCFSTWAYHANDLMGRGNKLLQVGIRASSRTKGYFEKNLQVKQFWADECIRLGEEGIAQKVIDHFQKHKIRKLYISNDIDGTDQKWASACGTPEPNGLSEGDVLTILDYVHGADIEVVGADLVELAPDLSLDINKSIISCNTARHYMEKQLKLLGV